ncbi:MAG TPA: VWA domain-containing protein [Solirubrobacteraceae bacterium]|nr:VWA domain-containing protein [Solirubrobacteraceae bacterium]
MKINLPSSLRAGASTGAGTPDPAEPPTTPLVEPVVPPPVAAPAATGAGLWSVEPEVSAGAGGPTTAVVGQVLPMYFVGDESHSMAGDPISAVNQGLIDLRDEVAKHPLIGKKVRFGIITFAETAQTRLELSELSEDLVLPTLSPRGRGTSYASALEALRQTIPADVALLKSGGYQVHRPSVFFLSDGLPTEKAEKWQARLAELKDPSFRERPNILAFGVGEADPEVIGQLASSPRYGFMMASGASTAGAIAEFAASMLNSMVASAERLDRGDHTIEFEKPEGFVQLDAPLV